MDRFSGLHISLGESITGPTLGLTPVKHGSHMRSASDSTSLCSTLFVSKLPPAVANVPKENIRDYMHTKRVQNYLVGSTLGEGSFAKVKEALHILVGEKVAMKVIDKKKALQDSYVSRTFRREAKLLQMVRHPNILQLLEIIETDNSYYLITELCTGGELMKHIYKKGKLDETETRKYMRQIVSAVDHLHKAGIIHRDLKVENLLLDGNMDVKIIDFGLSNEEYTEGEQGRVHCTTQCGSPAYAAPELLGHKEYGPEVDIWSIGVNMYAMLTGCLPYTVEPFNITTLHAKMLENKMNPIPDHLSANCKDLLRHLLISSPEKRIKMPDIMAHPWMNEGHSLPFGPAPFPNQLDSSSINNDVVEHMVHTLNVKESEEEVRTELTSNRSTAVAAVYHLLTARLARYERQHPTKMMRVRHKSKRVSQDQGYFEGEDDDDTRSIISCPTRPRGARPPVRRRTLTNVQQRPTSDGSLPDVIEEQVPNEGPRRQRRSTLPPTVLNKELAIFQQHRVCKPAGEPLKTNTLPRQHKRKEKKRNLSHPHEPYEFDIPHPQPLIGPVRPPPSFPRNSYSQPKELFQLRQNLHDRLHPPSYPAWHSNPTSRNVSRQSSRNPSHTSSRNPSSSSIAPPFPLHLGLDQADLDSVEELQFHHAPTYTVKVPERHAAMFDIPSPEEDLSSEMHFPTISQRSNRTRQSPGKQSPAPHHHINGYLPQYGNFEMKTDLGTDAIISEIVRVSHDLKMRESELSGKDTVICTWKGVRFSVTVVKDKRNGVCRLNFQWLSGGDHQSYNHLCEQMLKKMTL